MTSAREGIVFAVPGTTCPEAAAAFANIESAVMARLPGLARAWAYTSSGVRRKAAASGCHMDDPRQALARLRDDGVARIAVLSLHLSDGMEYGELKDVAESARGAADGFERVALGAPLLTAPDGLRRVADAIRRETAAEGRGGAAIVWVAHGSRPAAATFRAAADILRAADPRFFLGAVQCPPHADAVLQACRAAGVASVWLLPAMVAAGFSAREDIAGDAPGSWKSVLERGGVACHPVIRGLGEFGGVVEVWADQAERLVAELRAP